MGTIDHTCACVSSGSLRPLIGGLHGDFKNRKRRKRRRKRVIEDVKYVPDLAHNANINRTHQLLAQDIETLRYMDFE